MLALVGLKRWWMRKPNMLVEVEEVVDELQALGRSLADHGDGVGSLDDKLPDSLSQRIRMLLSKEGLQEVSIENREKARMRILESIGLCLEHSNSVTFIGEKFIGELSSSEVEELYRRLESSTALQTLRIDIPANASENCWQLFADILLGAQSLEKVIIEDQPLSGLALSQLASAVAASSGRGPCAVLEIEVKHGFRDVEGSQGVKESLTDELATNVANLLVVAPNLKELKIVIGPFAEKGAAELIVLELFNSDDEIQRTNSDNSDSTIQVR